MARKFLYFFIPVATFLFFCSVSLADTEIDFTFPTPAPTVIPVITPSASTVEIPEDYVIQQEDPSKSFVALTYLNASSTEKFLTKHKLENGCTAADCASYLRGSCDESLVSAVKARVYKANETALPRILLRLAANYPVYGGVSYIECDEVPLMEDGYTLASALNFNLHGYVVSDAPVTSITATIKQGDRANGIYPYINTVTYAPESNMTCCDLDSSINTLEGKSLNSLCNFLALSTGEHTITISATTTEQTESVELISRSFKVANTSWMQLDQHYFNDNYSQAYQFFNGQTDHFLFKYKWRSPDSVKIILDSNWRSTYTVEDEFGRVHVDAQPYFNKAREFIRNTYIRVSGGRHDSKVINLWKMIDANDGSLISRFTNNKKYISHHSLGTAVDLNAHYGPNKQVPRNKDRIYEAVAHNLVYNGIETDSSGRQYYDFTYNGTYKETVQDVPTEIMNYLLYELGFYRAGFRWGYYFKTPDSMHFSLTESRRELFEEGPYAMRKVFEYIDGEENIELAVAGGLSTSTATIPSPDSSDVLPSESLPQETSVPEVLPEEITSETDLDL